ncbi:MAG: 2'-5' RNA ligase family protein [Halobacteria archaeon]|nr:2'-5' RNA ligase family protein [Halobacteria archaeon]
MHAVVSFLDDEHNRRVEEIWSELEDEFGMRGIYKTPHPHISYQVAEEYNTQELEKRLEGLARSHDKFKVRAKGVDVFTVSDPVVYVPVVLNPQLDAFHDNVWRETKKVGSGFVDYYRPEEWVPHVTLAQHDVHNYDLPDIVEFLERKKIDWELGIDNIGYIQDLGNGKQEVRFSILIRDIHVGAEEHRENSGEL